MKRKNVFFVLAFCFLLNACGTSTAAKWQEQYDLGMRYLTAGNYEEAIIAFTAAIEIDPKQAPAYAGRGQSYHSLVSVLATGETVALLVESGAEDYTVYCYEQAIRDLEKAIELDSTVVDYYDEIIRTALEYGDVDLMLHYWELKYQNTGDDGYRDLYEAALTGQELLDRLAEAFQQADDSEIFSLMHGEDYDNLLFLQAYLDRPIRRAYSGGTLGLYSVNDPEYGDVMLYFGTYDGEQRSGPGMWYGYYDGNNFASKGSWSSDLPNGYFETKEWNSNLNEEVVYREVSGQVTDGLWNGNVIWAFDKETDYVAWQCSFVNGIGVNVSENGEHYFWSKEPIEGDRTVSLGPGEGEENVLQGISGFLSAESIGE